LDGPQLGWGCKQAPAPHESPGAHAEHASPLKPQAWSVGGDVHIPSAVQQPLAHVRLSQVPGGGLTLDRAASAPMNVGASDDEKSWGTLASGVIPKSLSALASTRFLLAPPQPASAAAKTHGKQKHRRMAHPQMPEMHRWPPAVQSLHAAPAVPHAMS
jgi:hypothetical protein